MYMCVYIYIYIYMHTYVYVCVYIYTHIFEIRLNSLGFSSRRRNLINENLGSTQGEPLV